MTPKQLRDLASVVVQLLPADMPEEAADNWLDNPEQIRLYLDGMKDGPAVLNSGRTIAHPIPDLSEEFELTIDGDQADPVAMAQADGYDPAAYEFSGRRVRGTQTRRFKLVRVGFASTLDQAIPELEKVGRNPEGVWREAFLAEYPEPDGRGPIAIADPSWKRRSDGFTIFPVIGVNGGQWLRDFGGTISPRRRYWRYLVEVPTTA